MSYTHPVHPSIKRLLDTPGLVLWLTGAGVSAESGIPTFRGKEGYWKVGSRNEVPGITGISHFFEHMMFNGAEMYGPKMFDRTMEAAGGANNAYTSENLTVYTNWFPSDSMEIIFELLFPPHQRFFSLRFSNIKYQVRNFPSHATT